MTTRPAHPAPERLNLFGRGRLPDDEAVEVAEHVSVCAACAGVLDRLPPDPFMIALRGAGRAGDAPTDLSDAHPTLTPGAPVGTEPIALPPELASHARYRVGELLGHGGMGAVYKAEHALMERPVALKVISPRLLEHSGAVERFRQEVKAAARLQHPNIVTAFDAEQVGPVTVLVMEFVEGRSLADVLADRGPLPASEACGYARQAALGLAHAHGLGMVHRDVKPHNLMLTHDGRVKILDFGIARFVSEEAAEPAPVSGPFSPEELTRTGACMGTPDYMAPEQARNARAADARSDVYALGATLYHLLAGRVPFDGGSAVEKLMRLEFDDPPPLNAMRPDLPPGLVAVVEQMMAKRPEDRFTDAAEAAAALEPFAGLLSGTVRRSRRLKVLAGFVALLVAVVGAVKLSPKQGGAETAVNAPPVTEPAPTDPLTPPPPGPVRRFIPGARFADHEHPYVLWPAVSPDGLHVATIACGSRFEADRLRLWRIDTGREVRTFDSSGDRVGNVAFAPDGRLLMSGEKELRVWDSGRGDPPSRVLKAPRSQSAGFGPYSGFSPDARWAATADEHDFSVRVWDLQKGEVVRTLKGHSGRVLAVAVSPDGKRVVSGGEDRTVRVWDAETGAEVKRFFVPVVVWTVRFSPDGRIAWHGGAGEIHLYDPAAAWAVRRLKFQPTEPHRIFHGLAFTPDGSGLLGFEDNTGLLLMWDTRSGRLLDSVRTAPGGHVVVTPDGKRAVTAHFDGKARVWWIPELPERPDPPAPGYDTPAPLPLVSVATGPSFPRTSANTRFPLFHPDGRHLFIPDGNTVVVWNVQNGRPVHTLTGPTDRVMVVRLTPDGKTLIGLSNDRRVFGWDWESGKKQIEFAIPDSRDPIALAVIADGTKIAIPGAANTVSVREWPSGKQTDIIDLGSQPQYVFTLAADPNGKWLGIACGRGRAWLWDVTEKRLKPPIPELVYSGPDFTVCSFSPDGKLFAVGSAGGLRVWKTIETAATPLSVVTNASGLVDFGPDGSTVTTAPVQPTGGLLAVTRWNIPAGTLDRRDAFAVLQPWSHCAVSPDGRHVAIDVEAKRTFVLVPQPVAAPMPRAQPTP